MIEIGNLILYLNEIWFDSYDTVPKLRSDCSSKSKYTPTGKKVLICHVGSNENLSIELFVKKDCHNRSLIINMI